MPIALGIGIGVLALFIFAYGSALAAHQTSTGFLGWLGEQVGNIPLFGPLTAKQLLRLDTWIAAAVAPAFAYVDNKIASFVAALGQLSAWSAQHGYRNSTVLQKYAQWLGLVKLPKVQKAAVKQATDAAVIRTGKLTPLGARARYTAQRDAAATLAWTEAAILKKIAHDPTWEAAIAADLPLARPVPGVKGGMTKAEIDAKVKEYVKAALAAAGLALPFPIPAKSPAIPKKQAEENADTNKRLRRLEKLLGITGLAALVGATFGKEIERFLRCKNTRGIAKAWCGANLNALLGLLTGLLAAVGVFSLIDFAHYIEDGIEDGAKLVLHFWSKDVASGIDQNFGDGGAAAKRDPSFGSA